jgi:uracil-DNA glycosylase
MRSSRPIALPATAGTSNRQPGPGELATRQRELEAYQEIIRGCRACVEAGYLPAAWPVFRGRAGQRVMVVGQAPAQPRSEHPRPYSGASGRTLRSWLVQAGFPPQELETYCYLTSVTKCFPGPSRSGKGDRAPSAAEVALCRRHLERELALVRPAVIITLGRLAARWFLGDRPLSELVGEVFAWPTREDDAGQPEPGRDGAPGEAAVLVLPLPHPSGVNRWHNDPANRAQLARALRRLAELRRRLDLEPLVPWR